jgi:two-component sensor histidine kinase
LSQHIHPADIGRVRTAFSATRGVMGDYEIDFRILLGAAIRWISARGQGNDADIAGRMMYGIFLDVTQRKQAEEANELLAGEMGHRVKNLLAIASALTSMTSRTAASTEDMARDLTHRLVALGRAHDLVRPLPGQNRSLALLGDLFTVLLAPYEDGAMQGRIRVSVPRISVGEGAATTLAMTIHELATNSMKYGALSVKDGLLDVSGSDSDNEIVVAWTERGGPRVSAPMDATGFGSEMVTRSMSRQLAGGITFDWSAEGLIATLRMSKQRLAA